MIIMNNYFYSSYFFEENNKQMFLKLLTMKKEYDIKICSEESDNMKFLHMADIHLDSPFATLAGKEGLSQERRLEQRKVMKDIVEYIKNNDIPYLFIAGDLYEQEYIRKSTIEYINDLFKQIPDTKIFITPGNHDPYINNSFYKTFNWNDNVHIYTDKLERIKLEEADIYGYGFNDFYMENKYENIKIENPDKINILITHGSVDGGNDENRQYNPMSSRILKNMGFDYVALGHIHKPSYQDYDNQKIIYPGSTISLGFDELGKRGYILADVEKSSMKLEFIESKAKTFEEIKLDLTNINSVESLLEAIEKLDLDEAKFYKILLVGKRNFEVNPYELAKIIKQENIIKIKDQSVINYNIEEIAKQINLKGLFAKNILNKIETQNDEAEKENLMKAFEIGIEILNK